MSEVKSLMSDSQEEEIQRNEKFFDCHLFGAKYYCTNSGQVNLGIVFDFCQLEESNKLPKGRTKISTAASSDDRKMNEMKDLGGPMQMTQSASVTTPYIQKKHAVGGYRSTNKGKPDKKQREKLLISLLRSIPHRDGFSSIEGEGDCNGFYVHEESKWQQKQLKHCFLRIYDKNKRIKLIQYCDRLRWPKSASLSRAFSSKLYNSIPFFVILMEFLFDNMDVDMKEQTLRYNYMSLMESIHCLLLFKNYHKTEQRKHNNKNNNNNANSDAEFKQCNILLKKKLAKLENEKRDYWTTWPEVCCCCGGVSVVFIVCIFGGARIYAVFASLFLFFFAFLFF